jgi:hemoglobin-like flavoprotein
MDDVGLNMLGKIISKLREQFYNELFDNYTELKKE